MNSDAKRWYLIARPSLSLRDRVRLLCGSLLQVRFDSPDGNCHAACDITARVVSPGEAFDWAMPDVLVFSVIVEVPSDSERLAMADAIENKLSDALKWADPSLEFRVTQVMPIWAPPKDMGE